LLDFYSSEIESHSNLIIGLALVLFAILQIPKLMPNVIEGLINAQTCTFVFIIWLISGSLWYFLMRHFAYGVLCKSVIEAPLARDIRSISAAVWIKDYAYRSNILKFFSTRYFINGNNREWVGWIICYLGFGIATEIFLLLLIGEHF
jgi:hypothetical protein